MKKFINYSILICALCLLQLNAQETAPSENAAKVEEAAVPPAPEAEVPKEEPAAPAVESTVQESATTEALKEVQSSGFISAPPPVQKEEKKVVKSQVVSDPVPVEFSDAAVEKGAAILVMGYAIFAITVMLLMIVSMWRIFSKAGQPGWASIIPIYNMIVLCQVAGKPWWWIFLCLIPVVNIVIIILIYAGLAQNFGKGGGFTVGIILLPIVFIPMLAFGSSQYAGGAES